MKLPTNEAKTLLVYYFERASQGGNIGTHDCRAEIESIVDYIMEAVEEMIVAARTEDVTQKEPSAVTSSESSEFMDISEMSINEIQELIQNWVKGLNEGDKVFVMYKPLGWSNDARSYFGKVERITEKRVILQEAKKTNFHRNGGCEVTGVNGYGDYGLIPPFLNPKDLAEVWEAMQAMQRLSLLKNIPASKLKEALSIIEEYEQD